MKTIAIYSRKSKFTGKGESIENQISKCNKFIEFKFEIDSEKNIDTYIDEGFTGRNENRPRYQELISKVKSGEIKHIVIYQLNRLGRNARDIHNTIQICTDLGCVIYSATEGFDSSTSFGRAVMGILASLAQLETEQLAERVKDNMYTLAKMGRWLGGQSPLGFDGVRKSYIDEDGKERSITVMQPNTDELKIVKLLYQKYLEEKSLSQVAKWSLTNNLKGKQGCDLDKSTINSILQNPVYVKSSPDVMKYLTSKRYEVCGEPNGNGLLRYGKNDEAIVAVSKHKGVINPETWLETQAILKQNTEKAPRIGKTKIALLTGILKCGCGSPMQMRYGRQRKNGTKPYYYLCSLKTNSGTTRCNAPNINGELLEEKLISYLKMYNKDTLIEELKNLLNDTNQLESLVSTESLDAEISKHNKSMKQLLEKLKVVEDNEIVNIIISEMTSVKDHIKKLEEKKSELLNTQSEISLCQSDLLNIINLLDDFNNSYDNLKIEERKQQLNILFDSIIYKDNKFHLIFNVKKN